MRSSYWGAPPSELNGSGMVVEVRSQRAVFRKGRPV
jgi:hypothetical protein